MIHASGQTLAPPSDGTPPGLADRGLRAVLGLAAVLLAWSWWRLEGYQIADAVEYLERAYNLVRGSEIVDSQAIRAFGFSGLLIPLFAVAELFGLDDMVWVVHAARVFQVLLSLALVATAVRIGARLGGRGAGYAAGVFLAANPVLLQWGVSPVSGVASALFVALALERTVRPADEAPGRRGLVTGLLLGAAVMMAYQTIIVAAPIVALQLVRRPSRSGVNALAMLAGVGAALLLQCVLDLLYYGEFGLSVVTYFLENTGNVAASSIHRFGQAIGVDSLTDLAKWIYDRGAAAGSVDEVRQGDLMLDAAEMRSKRARDWYLVNLHHALTWPGVVLAGLGVLGALRRVRWSTSILLLVIVGNALAMSEKGSKEFRLWLPLMPMIAVLAGLGWSALRGSAAGGARASLTRLLLVALVVLGAVEHGQRNTRRFGAFWRAMALANEAAPPRDPDATDESGGRTRVSCAYHWSVFLRESGDVHLIKLPKHLDHWDRYTEEEKLADLEAIASLDWFITHLPILTERPRLMEAVNRDFAVRAVFYDRREFDGLGPVYVLAKRTGEPGERTLYDVRHGLTRAEFQALRAPWRELAFDPPEPGAGTGRMELLGFDYGRVEGDDLGWVTYHWTGGGLDRDYTLLDRITSPSGLHAWQNNHQPAYGMLPTSTWPADPATEWVLSESYLVVPEADPYDPAGPDRPIGGAYLRGDRVPADLWFEVAVPVEGPDGSAGFEVGLRPVRPSDGVPIEEIAPRGHAPSPTGYRTSPDGFTWVGAFSLPVRDADRVHDAPLPPARAE